MKCACCGDEISNEDKISFKGISLCLGCYECCSMNKKCSDDYIDYLKKKDLQIKTIPIVPSKKVSVDEFLKSHPCSYRVFKDGSDGIGGCIPNIPCCSLKSYGNVNCVNIVEAGRCPLNKKSK